MHVDSDNHLVRKTLHVNEFLQVNGLVHEVLKGGK